MVRLNTIATCMAVHFNVYRYNPSEFTKDLLISEVVWNVASVKELQITSFT